MGSWSRRYRHTADSHAYLTPWTRRGGGAEGGIAKDLNSTKYYFRPLDEDSIEGSTVRVY